MMYDIFELHAKYYGTTQHTDRAGYIVSQLMDLLSTGICRTEREMRYYAERLNVSPKYLSATVRRMTGNSVTSFIDRHAVPILKKYLNDRRLSITQICEKMNFTTLSYFSSTCYCGEYDHNSRCEHAQDSICCLEGSAGYDQ